MVEFKAEKIGSEIVVKAIVETDGPNIKVHIPSFPLLQSLKNDFERKEVQKK